MVYFSPHVHAITYGKLLNVHTFETLTSWQYHNHGRKFAGFTVYGLRTRETVVKVMYYLLSHAWVRGNFKTVRNVRGMSSTKLLVHLDKHDEPDLCPVCNTHAVRVPFCGYDENGREIIPYQNIHSCDKAYRIRTIRTVVSKVHILLILERMYAAASRWWQRYYRDHHLFMCWSLPVTS